MKTKSISATQMVKKGVKKPHSPKMTMMKIKVKKVRGEKSKSY